MKKSEKEKSVDKIMKSFKRNLEKLLNSPRMSNEQSNIGMLSRNIMLVYPSIEIGGTILITKVSDEKIDVDITGFNPSRSYPK